MKISQTDKEVREKLASRGAGALSSAELLSIILQEGNGGGSALELSQRVLDSVAGNLCKVAKMDMRTLRMVEGIGVKRAALLISALELGRRVEREQIEEATTIRSSDDVVAVMRPMIADLPHEEFWVIYLSAANGVLDKVRVSQGGVSSILVDHKLVVKRAVELLASGIVVVHNHPSGIANPSTEDIELTHRLANAASLFEIVLLDHIIITASESASFKHLGLL